MLDTHPTSRHQYCHCESSTVITGLQCSREMTSPLPRHISALPLCTDTDSSCIGQRTTAPLEMRPLSAAVLYVYAKHESYAEALHSHNQTSSSRRRRHSRRNHDVIDRYRNRYNTCELEQKQPLLIMVHTIIPNSLQTPGPGDRRRQQRHHGTRPGQYQPFPSAATLSAKRLCILGGLQAILGWHADRVSINLCTCAVWHCQFTRLQTIPDPKGLLDHVYSSMYYNTSSDVPWRCQAFVPLSV